MSRTEVEMVETDDAREAIAVAVERAAKRGWEVLETRTRMQDWGYVVTLEVERAEKVEG